MIAAKNYFAEKRTIQGSRDHYVCSRETDGEKLPAICFFADHPTGLRFPEGFDLKNAGLILCSDSFADHSTKLRFPEGFAPEKAELILCSYPSPAETLQPYEARVYRWKN